MTNKELNLKILEIASSKAEWEIDALIKNAEKLQNFVFGIQESTDDTPDPITGYRERAQKAIHDSCYDTTVKPCESEEIKRNEESVVDKDDTIDSNAFSEEVFPKDIKLSDLTEQDKLSLLSLFVKMFVVEPKALAQSSDGIYSPKFNKLPEWLNTSDQQALEKAYFKAISTPADTNFGNISAPKGVYDNIPVPLTDCKDVLAGIYVNKMKEDALVYGKKASTKALVDYIEELPTDSEFIQKAKELWENYQNEKSLIGKREELLENLKTKTNE